MENLPAVININNFLVVFASVFASDHVIYFNLFDHLFFENGCVCVMVCDFEPYNLDL